LSFTFDRLLPTIGEQGHFLFAAEEVREIRGMGGKAACNISFPDHAPDRHRLSIGV